MDATMSLLVDGVLALLLVAVIVACFVVYRKLEVVREGQAEMAHVVDSLNRAVVEAQTSIGALRATAGDVEQGLGESVKGARALADELTLITQAGNNLADRIEQGLTAGRAASVHAGGQAGVPSDGQGAASRAVDVPAAAGPVARATGQAEPQGAPNKPGRKQQELMSALKQAR